MRGHTTGYAVPQFVIDAPGGGGKIPVAPEYMVGRDGDEVVLRNYKGQTFRYPDPLPKAASELPKTASELLPVNGHTGNGVGAKVHGNGHSTNGQNGCGSRGSAI